MFHRFVFNITWKNEHLGVLWYTKFIALQLELHTQLAEVLKHIMNTLSFIVYFRKKWVVKELCVGPDDKCHSCPRLLMKDTVLYTSILQNAHSKSITYNTDTKQLYTQFNTSNHLLTWYEFGKWRTCWYRNSLLPLMN